MAENNNQNGQDSTQQLINIFKAFKWRIIDFSILLIAILFLTLGFWKTILIIVLCLIELVSGILKTVRKTL